MIKSLIKVFACLLVVLAGVSLPMPSQAEEYWVGENTVTLREDGNAVATWASIEGDAEGNYRVYFNRGSFLEVKGKSDFCENDFNKRNKEIPATVNGQAVRMLMGCQNVSEDFIVFWTTPISERGVEFTVDALKRSKQVTIGTLPFDAMGFTKAWKKANAMNDALKGAL